MKFRYLVTVVAVFVLTAFFMFKLGPLTEEPKPEETSETNLEEGDEKYSGPEQFALFHKAIRTPEGALKPQYKSGYKVKELAFAKAIAQARKSSNARLQSNNGVLEWTERGPANVPGRTRGIIVDPDDPNKNTWFAGSAGGGVWKTTNAGSSWTLITPELSNMATTVIVMAPSNHNIIYLGTGEGFGNLDGISGNGMFKSTDRGQTWNYLPSTSNFNDINRAIVNPANANIVVVATNSGIYKTLDGGANWTQTSSLTFIQDLKANPSDFNIQYASRDGVGVLKSINGGNSWALSNVGMSPAGRVEIAVSPANINRIFASAEGSLSGTGSDLYISNDAGATWSIVNVSFNNAAVNFLGGQGWYDNTIACDPFNADVVYFGGVNIFKVQLTSGSSSINSYAIEEDGTSFLSLVNYSAPFAGGTLTVGSTANESVEIRFGSGMSQKAHRFLVPDGATTGVPDPSFTYTDYVDVPFEAWDITNNRQLMVSFRDQDRNGEFNLRLQNTDGAPTEQSREYLYIHDITYQPTASPSISVNGGHIVDRIYFLWPVLSPGNVWPTSIVDSELRIVFSSLDKLNASTTTASDAYGQFDGKNQFNNYGIDIHPDQHNIVMIPVTGSTYKILVANDGGIFISNTSATPGVNQGDWSMVGRTYNTNQFYGADKRPGKDEYIGGMQDNGTWKSQANINASSTTDYLFNIGGDGFEVIWHNHDDQKLIGGSQGNNFRKSIDGGTTWTNAVAGLSGDHPFISKLANSKNNPERIYTLSSAGVFRSTNFGTSWSLTPITNKWGGVSSLMDVEVSRANANIVWAGSGMVNSGALRNLHVSTDAGVTFNPTNNYTLVTLGGITKLASHPFEKNTAYALFSFAGKPKILRTTDLGQSWNDISGFGTGSTSTTGFPDVAVYCLYVRPDNPNILWAGTEIGIVESLDNGATWTLLNLVDDGFPNISVWDLKGQDDQIVIATHGRGIWTATVTTSQTNYYTVPEIRASGTSPKKELKLRIANGIDFDSVQFFVSNQHVGTIENMTSGIFDLAFAGITPGLKTVKLIAFIEDAPFHSQTYEVDHLNIFSVESAYSTYFNSLNDLKLSGLTLQNISGTTTGERKTLQTPHPYAANTLYRVNLLRAVKVNDSNPILHYSNIALTQPETDTVLIEATKNGLDWVPITSSYDASSNPTWLAAFTNNEPGQFNMFDSREIDLSTWYSTGDSILVRLSMHSNAPPTGWGWALNYITIQQEPTATENPLLSGNQLNLFPNPTDGLLYVEFELTRASEVRAEIIDLFGRSVLSKNLGSKNAGKHQEEFDLSKILRGNYLVILETRNGNKIGKISVYR